MSDLDTVVHRVNRFVQGWSKMSAGFEAMSPTLAERLTALLRDTPSLKAKLALGLGTSEKTISRWAKGETEPGAADAVRLAEIADVSLTWLLTGSDQVVSVAGSDSDVIWVPHLNIKASAGPGRVALNPELVANRPIAFREAWLRSMGVMPQNAHFLTAEGDSMYPTIQDGDIMLADSGYGRVANGKIYALVTNGLVVVKRLHLLAQGGLTLISDNDRYPPEYIKPEDVNSLSIEARIAWYGRAI